MRHVVAVFTLLLAPIAHAQSTELDAGALARAVSDHYAAIDALEMEFDQFSWLRDYETTRTSTGRVRIARPGHARIDYTSGLVTIADGADVLVVEPADGSWPAQYHRAHTDAATHGFGLLSGATDVATAYTTSLCDADGPSGTRCLELRPRTTIPGLARLRLWVEADGATRGRALQLATEDGGGNWNTFRFVTSSIRVDPTLDASLFDMTPPAGAREAAGSDG